MSTFQTIAQGDLKDVVVSNDGKIAYVSNAEGVVSAVNVATGNFISSWKVGTALGGMDLSQDGRSLVAVERSYAAPSAGSTTIVVTVHVLDLTTGQVRDFTTNASSYSGAFFDAVFTADGKVLLSPSNLVLDPVTGAFAETTRGAHLNGTLSASADGTKVIAAAQNISDMPIVVYQPAVGVVARHQNYEDGVSGFNDGFQAISPAGDMIFQSGVIYDGALNYKGLLSHFQKEPISVSGAVFSADGRSLYVLNGIDGQVLQLSTADWSILRSFSAGLDRIDSYGGLFNGGAYGDRLSMTSDGKYLLVLTDTALNAVNLSTVTPGGSDAAETRTGDALANVLRGYGGADVIDGAAGADSLYGGHGDDRLIGGLGNDLLNGGAGIDSADYSSAASAVMVDLTITYGGQDTRGAGVDTLTAIENLIGSAYDDRLTGDANANRLDGGAGSDTLRGGAGGDSLIGGAGADILIGGAGDDAVDGGDGFDSASYENAISGVRVDLGKASVFQNTRGDGLEKLSGVEGLKGSAFADVLKGDQADNSFEGGGGDDLIDGGAGIDTAIFAGASSAYSWALNANGSWTVNGLQGADTLLNIETLKFTDRTVSLQPSGAAVTIESLIQTGAVQTLASGAFGDAVLSPNGRTAYVSDNEGFVTAFDTATGEVAGRWKVGATLSGMDVSADGRYLVAADRAVENPTGDQWDYKATVKVHVLDLVTGQLTHHSTTASGYSRGFTDAAFLEDGKVMLTQDFAGSGGTPITILNPATGAFTQVSGYSQSGTLSATDDHKAVLIAPSNISDAPLYILKAGVQTSGHDWYADGVSGFNSGVQAISGDGSRVAQYVGQLHIYDGSLKYLVNLSKLHSELSTVFGMDFSADGRRLFVVDSVTDKLLQFSTSNWKIEQVYSLGVNIGGNSANNANYGNRVVLSDDGARLMVFDGSRVVSVNLKAFAPDGGTDGPDILMGGSDADRLEGLGADDMLSGGSGPDTLWGGEGNDTIEGGADFDQINGNQGNDTARGGDGGDWVVGGKDQDLLYGETGTDVVYGNLGNDTCYGGEDADWVRGGQGDDVIDGGAGNDWMAGDRGNDTVTGGAGADTFYFFAGAAIDRVTDFSSAAGDRVLLDAGQTYTLSFTGEGAVIALGSGDQMILVGVTEATIGAWL